MKIHICCRVHFINSLTAKLWYPYQKCLIVKKLATLSLSVLITQTLMLVLHLKNPVIKVSLYIFNNFLTLNV